MNVIDEIRRFLQTELRIASADTLDPDTPLVQTGVIDSLELTQLVGFLETRFGIEVADTEMLPVNLRSLSAMARFVERKRASLAG